MELRQIKIWHVLKRFYYSLKDRIFAQEKGKANVKRALGEHCKS